MNHKSDSGKTMKTTLRHLLIASFATLALAACGEKEAEKPKNEPVAVVVPTDPNDLAGWKTYMTGVVKNNMGGVRSRPFVYFVPAGDDDTAKEEAQRQLEGVQDVVLRGVLPGNMLAFGGPDPAKVATLVTEGFKDVRPNSMKGVKILVVAAAADEQRIRDVLAPGGGDFIFVSLP